MREISGRRLCLWFRITVKVMAIAIVTNPSPLADALPDVRVNPKCRQDLGAMSQAVKVLSSGLGMLQSSLDLEYCSLADEQSVASTWAWAEKEVSEEEEAQVLFEAPPQGLCEATAEGRQHGGTQKREFLLRVVSQHLPKDVEASERASEKATSLIRGSPSGVSGNRLAKGEEFSWTVVGCPVKRPPSRQHHLRQFPEI